MGLGGGERGRCSSVCNGGRVLGRVGVRTGFAFVGRLVLGIMKESMVALDHGVVLERFFLRGANGANGEAQCAFGTKEIRSPWIFGMSTGWMSESSGLVV